MKEKFEQFFATLPQDLQDSNARPIVESIFFSGVLSLLTELHVHITKDVMVKGHLVIEYPFLMEAMKDTIDALQIPPVIGVSNAYDM